MTWYVYWNIVIVQTYDFSVVRPVCQNNLESTIKYSGVYICLIIIVLKFTVCPYDISF